MPKAPTCRPAACATDLPLPEVSQIDVVRHYLHLSQLNYSIDSGFYPLGSCTMKYNPKINEDAARLPGFAFTHPLQDPLTRAGRLALMFDLQEWLKEIGGFAARDAAAGGRRARRVHRRADHAQVSSRPGRHASAT